MKESELLKILMTRLVQYEGMSNVFSADEIKEWPRGAFEFLKNQGLLKKTHEAQNVECNGCEEYCFMPVIVRSKEKTYIECDKRDDMGRVPVKPARLEQWKITGPMLAQKLVGMLGFDNDPIEKQGGKSWELGVIKGKVNRPYAVLDIEHSVCFKIGTHDLDLLDVLVFKKGKLILDVEEIYRIADKPKSEAQKQKSNVIKREARKLKTEALHKSWQKQYRELKGQRRKMSKTWYAQQIAKKFGDKYSYHTIRKNMEP